jgi:hypothetical protein
VYAYGIYLLCLSIYPFEAPPETKNFCSKGSNFASSPPKGQLLKAFRTDTNESTDANYLYPWGQIHTFVCLRIHIRGSNAYGEIRALHVFVTILYLCKRSVLRIRVPYYTSALVSRSVLLVSTFAFVVLLVFAFICILYSRPYSYTYSQSYSYSYTYSH